MCNNLAVFFFNQTLRSPLGGTELPGNPENFDFLTKNGPELGIFFHVYNSNFLLTRWKVKILEDLERLEPDLSKSSRILTFYRVNKKLEHSLLHRSFVPPNGEDPYG